MISLIWAMTKDRLVGKDNLIPWHIKEDLLYFKEKTQGKTVLMGEATYYSLKGYYKNRPLPYGKIYVASLSNIELEDATIINDLKSFLENIKEDIMVIGGKTIYELSMPYADYLYITLVKGEYKGNIYLKPIDFTKFELESKRESQECDYYVLKKKVEEC